MTCNNINKNLIVWNPATQTKTIFKSTKEAAETNQIVIEFLRTCCSVNKLALQNNSNVFRQSNSLFYFYEKDFDQQLFMDLFKTLKYECLECHTRQSTSKALATHLQITHNLSSEQYAIKHFYGGVQPKCKICSGDTRYVDFTFKAYCKEHAKEAMKLGGVVGGKAEAWNKGKTKETDERILRQSILMEGEQNHFYGKQHTQETKDVISKLKTLSEEEYIRRINTRTKHYEVLTPYSEYTSRQHQKLLLKCTKCNRVAKRTLQAYERGCLCSRCYPFTVSKQEIEIGDYVESLGFLVERNRRDIIAPYELDVYVPEKKTAIEFNGLYWHSDRGQADFDKNAHRNKTNSCLENGVKLIQIFSDEWEFKQDLVKSMICSRLGKSPNVVFARKCTIREVDNASAKEFFGKSHVAGYVMAKKTYGLYHNDLLIAAISLRSPFHKLYSNHIEIARFAALPFYSVVGGFSKLFKHALKQPLIDGRKILSYCDRKWGEGNVYLNAGFSLIGSTKSDYWYTDGKTRFNRFRFKAAKAHGKTEKMVAMENGVSKIYGSGSHIYEYDPSLLPLSK